MLKNFAIVIVFIFFNNAFADEKDSNQTKENEEISQESDKKEEKNVSESKDSAEYFIYYDQLTHGGLD